MEATAFAAPQYTLGTDQHKLVLGPADAPYGRCPDGSQKPKPGFTCVCDDGSRMPSNGKRTKEAPLPRDNKASARTDDVTKKALPLKE